MSQWHYNIIGLLVGILGVIGDMFESLVKRAGFAKDSGVFFPGTKSEQATKKKPSTPSPRGNIIFGSFIQTHSI